MATHASLLAWRIPGTEESGGSQSMRLQNAGHNWSNLACTDTGGQPGRPCRERLCAPGPTLWSPSGLTVAQGPAPPGDRHDFNQSSRPRGGFLAAETVGVS